MLIMADYPAVTLCVIIARFHNFHCGFFHAIQIVSTLLAEDPVVGVIITEATFVPWVSHVSKHVYDVQGIPEKSNFLLSFHRCHYS